MNTEQAKSYLESFQIEEQNVFDTQDTAHPLDYLLEDYHQEQLKLLSKNDIKKFTVNEILKELEDSETLDDAILFFKEENNKP